MSQSPNLKRAIARCELIREEVEFYSAKHVLAKIDNVHMDRYMVVIWREVMREFREANEILDEAIRHENGFKL